MICATLVNTQTDRQLLTGYTQAELMKLEENAKTVNRLTRQFHQQNHIPL